MSDQYTPGPWKKVAGNKNREFNAIAIRPVSPERKGSSASIASVSKHPKSWRANASLIASAPDLLESLREVVAYCEETGNNWMCLVTARRAIAKAEGGAA